MIYLNKNPVQTLVSSNGSATLQFRCPLLSKKFYAVLKGPVTGYAVVEAAQTQVNITGECLEGTISVTSRGDSYVIAMQAARSEFSELLSQWIDYHYGHGHNLTLLSPIDQKTWDLEGERFTSGKRDF